MQPCWSCGVVDGPCVEWCECAKCVDPIGYAEWRDENPDAYARWMARNVEDEDEADRWRERAEELG
jgi:hypothetical protein